jgi:hypothetical protein
MSKEPSGSEAMPVQEHVAGAPGSFELNEHLGRLAIMMREMEQGMRPAATLDTQASPSAARRIRHELFRWMKANTGDHRRTTPTSVLRATSSHPSVGVAEAVVVTLNGEKVRSYSIRLEEKDHRWMIVDIAPPESDINAAVTAASRLGAVPVGPDGVRRAFGQLDTDTGAAAEVEDATEAAAGDVAGSDEPETPGRESSVS